MHARLLLAVSLLVFSATAGDGSGSEPRAEYAPVLGIYSGLTIRGRVDLRLRMEDLDGNRPDGGSTLRATVYVPRGYEIDTSLAAGRVIGKGEFPLAGAVQLVVSAPTVPAGDACGEGVHASVWRLAAPGETNPARVIRITVDPATAEEAQFASYRLHVCPLDPNVGPRRRLSVIDVSTQGVFTSPAAPGAYLWRSVFESAPWSGTFTPEPVESLSLARLPTSASVSVTRFRRTVVREGKRVTLRRIRLAGRVLSAGGGIAYPDRASIVFRRAHRAGELRAELFRGGGPIGTITTDPHGSFAVDVRDPGETLYRSRVRMLTRPAPELCAAMPAPLAACKSGSFAEVAMLTPIIAARGRR